MSHRFKIQRAIASLGPVAASLSRRRPRGMTAAQADRILAKVDRGLMELRDADQLWEQAESWQRVLKVK